MDQLLRMVMPSSAYEVLQKNGLLVADGRRVPKSYRHGYRWMAKQMCKRIGPSPTGINYPLWAWAQRGDETENPSRRFSCRLPSGVPGYLITFRAKDGAFLLSDFIAWDAVLDGVYLAKSFKDREQFQKELNYAGLLYEAPYLEPFKSRVENSWESIFDLGELDRKSLENKDHRSIQATLWELNPSSIVEVEAFVAE